MNLNLDLFFDFWFIFHFNLITDVNGNLINVAFNKSAHQAGIVGHPWRAVDGNPDTNLFHWSCTSTETLNRPFWEVDLGSLYTIYYIRVNGRSDCCADRLGDVLLTISSNKSTYSGFGTYPGQMPVIHEFRPSNPVRGRWMKLTLEKTEILTLCEVQVMSRNVDEKNSLKMKLIQSVKGNGRILSIWTKGSSIQCAQQCLFDQSCFSMNVIELTTSPLVVECQLLDSGSYSPTFWTNVKYYELGE